MSNTTANKKPRILVADDDEGMREMYALRLQAQGWEVVLAEDGQVALNLWNAGGFEALSTDLDMPNMTGLELAALVLRANPTANVFMCSGGNDDKEGLFRSLGGKGFFNKLDMSTYMTALKALKGALQ